MSSPPPRRGLGRGLELLLGTPSTASDDLQQLPIGSVRPNPRQPRRHFDQEAIEGLAESIRAQGVVQPVIVRPDPEGGYELIAGERRWRAAQLAGLATVPALIRESDDREAMMLALVENVARENLSPVEEARAYAVLMDELGLGLGEVAERVGRSKATVSNRVRLLELADDVLSLVERGKLTEGHARAVLAVPDHEDRRRLARRIAVQGLTVRAAERAATEAGARTRPRRGARVDPALAERARELLVRLTGAEVVAARGRLELRYADEVALEELVESLERVSGAVDRGAPTGGGSG
ncbi:MAG: ParB/RepB/Spo0J family partition protein [Thermoleophilia bacterium]